MQTIPADNVTDPAPSLLLTRPRPASEAFAARCRAAAGPDLRIVISPLLEISPQDPGRLPAADLLIFTSANGVAHHPDPGLHRRMVAYCVGERTAQAALEAGFRPRIAGGSADDLVETILRDRPQGRLLHLAGHHRRGDLVHRLAAAGLRVEVVTVYDQQAAALSEEALALLRASLPVVVPLFSPRTAEIFASGAPPGRHIRPVCISEAAASVVPFGKFAAPEVIARPDATAMFNAVLLALRVPRAGTGPGVPPVNT